MNLIMCPAHPCVAVSHGPLGYSNSRLKEPVAMGQHGVPQSFRIERLLSENAAEGDDSRKAADWSVDGEVELHNTPPSGGPAKHSRSQSSAGNAQVARDRYILTDSSIGAL